MNQANVLTATPTATCRLHSTTKANTMSTKSLKARLTTIESKLNNNKANTMNTKSVQSNFNTESIAAQESIMIGNTRIEMKDGLYSLNDLHKASDTKASKSPSKWLANKGTQAFITETRIRVAVANGNVSGTFTEKKAVYAYAMWISPLFQSHVIDVFDAHVTGTLQNQAPAQHQIPQTLGEALLLAGTLAQENEQQAAQLALNAPKVEYYEEVISSTGNLRVSEIAGELGMSAIVLNRMLEEYGMQRKINKRWVLTVAYAGQDYSTESTYVSDEGNSYNSLMWTQKGRKLIIEVINKMRG